MDGAGLVALGKPVDSRLSLFRQAGVFEWLEPIVVMRTLPLLFSWLALLAGSLVTQAQRTATATATIAGQFVVDAKITDGGAGYVAPPVVTFVGGGGSGAVAITQIINGSVTQINVTQAGSGYTNAPAIVIDGPQDFVTRGLIAYYPLDGNARDTVGGNSGASIVAKLTSDRFGHARSAYKFDGNGSYIAMQRGLPEMISATISLWVSMDDWTGYQQLYIDGDGNPGHDFAGSFAGGYGVATNRGRRLLPNEYSGAPGS